MTATCEPLTRKDNERLYERLWDGDHDARDQMIAGNVRLVTVRVNAYIAKFPACRYLQDDMMGEGFLALSNACDQLARNGKPEDSNPTGYLQVAITRAIGKLVDREMNFNVPSQTAHDARKRGETIPKQVSMTSLLGFDVPVDPGKLLELRDTIESCAESHVDTEIIRRRERGETDAEIAAALEMPLSTINLLRRELYDRFLEQTGLER